MVVQGKQITQCWSCNAQYSRDETPSWPYCPNCAQPAWEVLTSAQQAKVAEAHRRLIQAWQEMQGKIRALEEKAAHAQSQRDSLQAQVDEYKDKQRDAESTNENVSYIADLEAEHEYYKQSYIELRDWMSGLVDERDRAVLERNYFRESHEELHDKVIDLTDERDMAIWERERMRDDLAKIRDASQAVKEERDKTIAERDHYKERFLKLHNEMTRLRERITDDDTMPTRPPELELPQQPPAPAPTTNGRHADAVPLNPELLEHGDRLQAITGNWGTLMMPPQHHDYFGWRAGVLLDDGGFFIELPLSFFNLATRDDSVLWSR